MKNRNQVKWTTSPERALDSYGRKGANSIKACTQVQSQRDMKNSHFSPLFTAFYDPLTGSDGEHCFLSKQYGHHSMTMTSCADDETSRNERKHVHKEEREKVEHV